ncbi:DUF2304 domain-containing protein [Paenibacillus alginolyticus]|uniref:DUF2304 domain-containing protein n=1 Tax=Paenibacillus alginolyticus TaxID=59839 RepID=A0ABT4GP33_9BACL|nr:DUF2304 domain-containing protein [Paenibacillus alginolyticus]MCY9664238.1 DUF2304 domain-containing protein [Paenibacillus alginolyticus]MCY9697980.1 DUF2304 domain-containing protein [Paenibacillus alginolyticus]MEC0145477.1 DUF2304 domain-containing protein [Paenibacillus alginolyticus]
MSELLKLILLACGLGFGTVVVRLLLKKKISERNSIAWMSAAILILILSAFPEMVDKLAQMVHVSYPPSLIFLFSTLVLLLLVLFQSIQISILNEKIKELAQRIALSQHLEQKPQEQSEHQKVE